MRIGHINILSVMIKYNKVNFQRLEFNACIVVEGLRY